MTFIREASDLHLEFTKKFLLPVMDEDKDTILILSGDISVIEKFKQHALTFFKDVCSRFKHVIYVFGNHEYYRGSIYRAKEKLKEILDKDEFDFSNLHILEKETVELENIIFFGTTLWSDFEKGNPLSLWDANAIMTDFKIIRTGSYIDPYVRKFRAEHALLLHSNNLKWLDNALSENKGKCCVVVTHHAPSYKSVADIYLNDRINGAYVSDLTDLIVKHQPKLWFHGHTHTSFDYNILDTRIICNPKGYPLSYNADGSERFENSSFDPCFRLEI